MPVLYHTLTVLGIDPEASAKLAVGTSLATIVPTAIQSARAHHAKGAVDTALLKWWWPFIGAGVALGVLVAGVFSGFVLTGIFAAVAGIVAIYMLAVPEGTHIAGALPPRPVQGLIATLVGIISTLMGIGGGTLTVPILSLFSYPVRRAVGTASVIGLVIAVPGAAGFVYNGWRADGLPPFSLGYVNWVGFLLIAATSIFLAPLGARVAHAIPQKWLRRAFGLFLAITAARMLFAVIRQLAD